MLVFPRLVREIRRPAVFAGRGAAGQRVPTVGVGRYLSRSVI